MNSATERHLPNSDAPVLYGHQKWLLNHLGGRAIADHDSPTRELTTIQHGNTAITVLPHSEYGDHLYIGEPGDANPHLISVKPPLDADTLINEPRPMLAADKAQAHIDDLRRRNSHRN